MSAMFRVLTILCFVNLSETASTLNHLRVLNGRDAAEGEYPFVVLLVKKKKNADGIHRFCSASAITQKWVLSAGHCVDNKEAKNIFVWYTNFTKPPREAKLLTKVRRIVCHPALVHHKEKKLILYNDISLLHTEKLRVASYGRLLAVDHLTMIGLPVEYVGGGRTLDPKGDTFRPLQVGQAAVTTCDKRRKVFQIHLICISAKCFKREEKPFRGDSGGPLLFSGNIMGVCSFGGKSPLNLRTVFTPVSPYIDWIYNVMRTYGLDTSQKYKNNN